MEWLLWIDIETTGLDIEKSKIIQIACVLTNFDLSIENIIPEITINCEESDLLLMDEWCKNQHSKSGLLDKVKTSKININQAEETILTILNQNVSIKDKIYIAGNSVHFDKKFIDFYMPKLSKFLSYRIVDVSSFSIVYRNIFPKMHSNRPLKKLCHTAQQDIFESMEEYKYYINCIKSLDKIKEN